MKTVIIEGIDRAGKTSLALKIEGHFKSAPRNKKCVIYHNGKSIKTPPELEDEYIGNFEGARKEKYDFYILDRSQWGNLIYSKFYRQTKLTHEQVYAIHTRMEKNSSKIYYILAEAPEEMIKERFIADGESVTKAEHIVEIQKEYVRQFQFLQENFPKTIMFRVNVDTKEETILNLLANG